MLWVRLSGTEICISQPDAASSTRGNCAPCARHKLKWNMCINFLVISGFGGGHRAFIYELVHQSIAPRIDVILLAKVETNWCATQNTHNNSINCPKDELFVCFVFCVALRVPRRGAGNENNQHCCHIRPPFTIAVPIQSDICVATANDWDRNSVRLVVRQFRGMYMMDDRGARVRELIESH